MLTALLWLGMHALVSVLFNPYAHVAVSARGASAILEVSWALTRQLPWPLIGAVLLLMIVFFVLRGFKKQVLGGYVLAYAVLSPLILAPAIVFMSDSIGSDKGWALLMYYLALVFFMLPIPFFFWWIAKPGRLSLIMTRYT